MKIVVQRVKEASVAVDNKIINKIKQGFLLLVAVHENDTLKDIEYCAKKVAKLRVFTDDNGLLNLDINQINGEILSISQFTLYGNTKKGNRPSFTSSAKGEKALDYYNKFNELLSTYNINVYPGVFGEYMDINLVNDGPVTIIIDSFD